MRISYIILSVILALGVHSAPVEENDGVPSIPHIDRATKWKLIRESGQDPTARRRPSKGRSRRLVPPWRRTQPEVTPEVRPKELPQAVPVESCPPTFDAITRGYNDRTYIFSGEKVFQTWIENAIPQKAVYRITELFAGGPRTVTAVVTNSRSGVTTLFSGRQAYRFRWNKEYQRFWIARNSPKQLNANITLTPRTAFEWEGHQVILEGGKFVTYDPYWNIATFTDQVNRYFPQLPYDLLGVLLDRGPTILLYTKRNTVQVYDRKKHRIVSELPVKISEMAGCLFIV